MSLDPDDRRLLVWIAVSTTFLAGVLAAMLIAWAVYLVVRL